MILFSPVCGRSPVVLAQLKFRVLFGLVVARAKATDTGPRLYCCIPFDVVVHAWFLRARDSKAPVFFSVGCRWRADNSCLRHDCRKITVSVVISGLSEIAFRGANVAEICPTAT